MEVLNIDKLLLFKTDVNTLKLDDNTLESFNLLFGHLKNKKNFKKVNTNILKNQKIQNKKEIISNKVNLILNKLSESNMDNLIVEFIQNINQVDLETFNEILKTFYLKIISEINFIKIYIQFLKILGFLYNNVQNYDLSYFYSIVESKFMLDYTDYDIVPGSSYDFIKNHNGESTRINNLILIKNLVENNMLSTIIYDICDKIIINQSNFIPDIYHWFGSKNRDLTQTEINLIEEILTKTGINSREVVLLENLINRKKLINTHTHNMMASISMPELQNTLSEPCINKQDLLNNHHVNDKQLFSNNKNLNTINKAHILKSSSLSKIQNKNTILKNYEKESDKICKTDTFQLECDNIIEEYLIVKSNDEIKYFIINRCVDAISKNKFCEYTIDKYFLVNKENSLEILELLIQLVKNRILFKSNLSRGLLLINNIWKEKSIDYNKPIDKMKTFLIQLKKNGITNSIEFLLDQYKIK
jgi:predicted transcriptional regulator